jgi:AraC-like DNA-binding protein
MLSSAVLVANDADEFAMLVRPTTTEHTIIGGGAFAAKAMRINLHRLGMQRVEVSHSSIGNGQQRADLAGILFSTGGVVWKGAELSATDIGLVGHDQPYWYNMAGPAQFGSMSLPVEDLANISVAMIGRDLSLPRDGLTMTATAACHAKLLRLHDAAVHLAENAPDIIHHPEAARGLEQAMIEAMFDCIAGPSARTASQAWGMQSVILKRFRAALEANVDQPVYIPEICQSIGVAERTLRTHCHEHLGMSPKQYLLLRRMNLAHQALRAADPSTTTVTEIATRFGFWELGRFAVAYHAWCGESPSASLRRAAN